MRLILIGCIPVKPSFANCYTFSNLFFERWKQLFIFEYFLIWYFLVFPCKKKHYLPSSFNALVLRYSKFFLVFYVCSNNKRKSFLFYMCDRIIDLDLFFNFCFVFNYNWFNFSFHNTAFEIYRIFFKIMSCFYLQKLGKVTKNSVHLG